MPTSAHQLNFLGDKENHIASVHFAQMLYIWPYFIFFSFPLIYPYILNCIISQNHLPTLLRYGSTRHQIPRFWVWILLLVSILGIIHFNTIIHPFTLADNRHYMFYVFRILLRYKWIKYAVAPVYLICGWATIICFGGLPNVQNRPQARLVNKVQFQYNASIKDWIRYTVSIPAEVEIPPPGNRVSLGLIWLLATALSLVTAPLVEPRYFIVPWLIWRLHVQSPRPQPSSRTYWQPSSVIARIRYHLLEQHDHRLWIETAWFLAINLATGYVFLYRGFEWPQEPGQVQRFMW